MSSVTLETPAWESFPPISDGPSSETERLPESRRLVTDCLIAKFADAYPGDTGIETILPQSNEYGFIVDTYAKHFSGSVFEFSSLEDVSEALQSEAAERREVLQTGLGHILSLSLLEDMPDPHLPKSKVQATLQLIETGVFTDLTYAFGCTAYQEMIKQIKSEDAYLRDVAVLSGQTQDRELTVEEGTSPRRLQRLGGVMLAPFRRLAS